MALAPLHLLLAVLGFTLVQGELYLLALAANRSSGNVRAVSGSVGGPVNVTVPAWLGYDDFSQLDPFSSADMQSTDWVTTVGVQNKSLLVDVPDGADVSIFGHFAGDGSTLALPLSVLGTRYIISSCDKPDASYQFVMAVATHDLASRVDITFRLEGSVSYDDTEYEDGDRLSVPLDEYEVLTIVSDFDLSGTLVVSSQSVAVFAGTGPESGGAAALAYEQMLPTYLLGTEYVAASFPSRDSVLQIVSEDNDATIQFNNGTTMTFGDGRVYRQPLTQGEPLYFNSSAPVMTTICTRSNPGLNLVVVPPTAMFTTGLTTIWGCDVGDVLILSETDGEESQSVDWTEVENTAYRVGVMAQSGDGICQLNSTGRHSILVNYEDLSSYATGYNTDDTITWPPYSAVYEDEEVMEMTITRHAAYEELTVYISSQGLTATGNTDYVELEDFQVTFPAGAWSTTFDVQLMDDSVKEGHETLLLQVTAPNIRTSMTTLILVDNEGGIPFDCRRHGQSCASENDICHPQVHICDCVGTPVREGESCSIVTDQVGGGDCGDQCGEHGTCVFDLARSCICDSGYYGDPCEYYIFQVLCSVDGMTFFAKPHGLFSGEIYPLDLEDDLACHLDRVNGTPGVDYPDHWQGGLSRYFAHNDDCGTIPVVQTDTVTSYTREFLVQYDPGLHTGVDQLVRVKCYFNNNISVGHSIWDITTNDDSFPVDEFNKTFVPFRMEVAIDGAVMTSSTAFVAIKQEICITFNVTDAFTGIEIRQITFNDTIPGSTPWLVYNDGCVKANYSTLVLNAPHYPLGLRNKRHTQFCFRAFRFTGSNKLGALFTLGICITPGGCEPHTCSENTRRKRQADTREEIVGATFTVLDEDTQTDQDQNNGPEIVNKGAYSEVSPGVIAIIAAGCAICLLMTIACFVMLCKITRRKRLHPQTKYPDYAHPPSHRVLH